MENKRKYPYYIENPAEHDRVRQFLNIFAAILETSSYRYILDLYSRVAMRCSRCTSECQIYSVTKDPKDIPCHRSDILLRVYKRHFTLGGWLKAKLTGGSELPLKGLRDTLEFLEEEIEEIKGVKVKFPIEVFDAEYAFFTPVSDYLVEPDTLMGIACVLHEGNVKWTIPAINFDGVNYGLFYSDSVLGEVLRSLIKEVRRVRAKKILVGECGDAYRVIKDFLPTYDA